MTRSLSLAGLRALLLAVFCAGTGALGAEEAIPIRLERPLRKGMMFQVNGGREMTLRTRASVGGAVKEDKTTKEVYEFALTVQVDEVDATGRIASATIAVGILTKQEGDRAKHDLAANGTTLHAVRREGKTDYAGPVLKDGRELLDQLVPFALKPGEPDQDTVFGGGEPRRVGDTWDIDKAALLRLIRVDGLDAAADGISGQMKLASRGVVNGIDCYLLHSVVNVQKLLPPPDGLPSLPPGVRFRSGTMKQTFGGVFPVAQESIDSSQENLAEITFILSGRPPQANADVTMESHMRAHAKYTYRLVK